MFKNKKTSALLVSLAMLLTLSVSSVLAWFVTDTETAENTFTLATVPIKVKEEVTGDLKTNVKIENTGDTAAYIRAQVVVTWVDEDTGSVFGERPKASDETTERDYKITFPKDTNWVKHTDGYYYYTKAVPATEEIDETDVLFTDCKPLAATRNPEIPGDYTLSIEIIAQSIQARGGSKVGENFVPAVTQVWNVEVNSDGTLIIPQS